MRVTRFSVPNYQTARITRCETRLLQELLDWSVFNAKQGEPQFGRFNVTPITGLSFPPLAIRAAYVVIHRSKLFVYSYQLAFRRSAAPANALCLIEFAVCSLSRFDNFCDLAVNEFDEVAIAIDEVLFDAGRSRLFDDAHVLWNCQPDET